MSRKLRDSDIAQIEEFLSKERLKALVERTKSARAAIEIHQQTLQLGTALMTVIAVIEIALRNSVNDQLTAFFGTSDWLRRPPPPFKWGKEEKRSLQKALDSARRAQYAKLSQAEKHALDLLAYPAGRPSNLSHSARSKGRQAKIVVSDGQVVASTTMYFWKRVFAGDYEASLWKTTLKRLFPDKKIRRADVASQLEHVYKTRNRLAHHEPVSGQRLTDAVQAIKFVTSNLRTHNPANDTALARLVEDMMDSVEQHAQHLQTLLSAFPKP